MLDVGWGDLIDYFGDDPRTRSIVIYMESIGDARAFLSAAREVSLTKPIIVIKVGKTEEASRAAASHTGALTGSDAVLEAAFRRVGVLRVNSIAEIFFMTDALAKQPRPRGNRLCIMTNAGGPGVLATDAPLDRAQCRKLAELGHDALALAISPVHTMFDGDVVFALSTAPPRADRMGPAEFTRLGMAAVDALREAILRSVERPEN